jgi:hypothetical protein
MSDQQSPWAKPESEDSSSPVIVVYPPPPSARPTGRDPSAGRTDPSAGRTDPSPGRADQSAGRAGRTEWSRSGTITQLHSAPPPEPDVIQSGKPRDPAGRQRRMLLWFGGSAALIMVIGVVVLLALAMTGNSPIRRASGPSDYLPPLAKACPPPSANAASLPPAPPPPPGPRTVDTQSGISYAAQGGPWMPWNQVWTAGDLHVKYGVGQHFVTETYDGGQEYHASILSGSVPAAENDALTLDLKCTGHQVLADVRASYYPQPTTMDTTRDEVTTLGGRPAWVSEFRLHFHADGLKASSELVGLALIDVGRPNAAVLYISIPNTVSQFDPVVDQVLESVRPT